ncbi:MAG TPA: N-acetyltransferase [Polyangiaceae bacterium]|nr:N-acetyltransferase [Polyangiaceae bacterium]
MAKPSCEIRRATPDDIAGIARIHVESWQSAYRGVIPDVVLDALDQSQRASLWSETLGKPAHRVHVAVRDQMLVGFCLLAPSRDPDAGADTAEIVAIYVAPAHFRTGVGTALLRESLVAAQSACYRAVTLWVLASNTRARAFYQGMGFAPDGGHKLESFAQVPLAEVRYRRDLDG